MLDPELERKNMVLGWALFGVFVLLFAGTVLVALLYLPARLTFADRRSLVRGRGAAEPRR